MHRIKRLSVFCLAIFILSYFCIPINTIEATTEDNLNFDSINTKDGLSSNFIWCIMQDHYGYMWFGSAYGLNKYDGINFNIYKNDPAVNGTISNSDIRCIYETADNELWIGTSQGLNLFNRETETFTTYLNNPDDPDSISSSYVLSIYEDIKHNLWIGTSLGLNLFNRETQTFTRYLYNPDEVASISSSYILSMNEDNNQNLWVGTIWGLNLFNSETETFTRYFNNLEDPDSISDNYITTIFRDSDGTMWIGTGKGLNRYNYNTRTFSNFRNDEKISSSISDNYILSLSEDDNGYMWIGTSNGLNRFDKGNSTFIAYTNDISNPSSLNNNRIMSVYKNNENIIWIGTSSGINILNFNKQVFKSYTSFLYNNTISGICSIDDGYIWLATNMGIIKFSTQNKIITEIWDDIPWQQDIAAHISNLFCIGIDGCLWYEIDYMGLARFNPVTGVTTHYRFDRNNENSIPSDSITCLFIDHNGIVWIGTEAGLCSFNPELDTFRRYVNDAGFPFALSMGRVTAIYETSDYHMWFGTNSGLFMMDADNSEIISISDEDLPSGIINAIYSMCEGSGNKLWIATAFGLFCYDMNTKKFISYGISDNALNDWILGVVEDNSGNIWVTSRHGIGKLSLINNSYKQYYMKDGLKNDGFCVGANYKSDSGELFFGTMEGLVSFYPDDIKDNVEFPQILINSFSLPNEQFYFEQPIEEIKEVTLSYSQNSFIIDFVALSYNSPRDNVYAYKLDGFEDNWNYCTANDSFAKYTNINPGEYTFVVKGSNNYGIWSEEGTSLKIVINNPFWMEWWFITMLIIIALSAVVMAIRIRTITLTRYARSLENQFEERTLELAKTTQQLKLVNKELELQMQQKSYSTDAMMHDIKTPLTSLISASELLISEQDIDKTELPKQVYKSTAILQKRVNDYFELIKNEHGILELNREPVSIENLIADVIECTQSKITKKNIDISLDLDSDIPEIDADQQKVTQIILNLLDNAIKFTAEKGKISIKTNMYNGELLFEINNTGSNISLADLKNIFIPYYHRKKEDGHIDSVGLGLSICKIYVELHGGRIWAENKNGNSTSFYFTIPVYHEHKN
jgi:ligand-binding sensor domain-containing protein/signal transduction histidine kinase